jgi:hypothetical protein
VVLKKILLATAAIVGLVSAAQAQQIPSMDQTCARPDLTVSQKVACSSPRLKANAQRNITTLYPLVARLSPSETVALLQTLARQSNEHMTYCRVPVDRMPVLPLSQPTEDCLAGWQDVAYYEYQRGILPDHNPATASSVGLTAEQQAKISQVQARGAQVQAAHAVHEQVAARCRLLANNSGSGWFAYGSPVFVGLSALANRFGEAARASNNYRDCMLAQGQQP